MSKQIFSTRKLFSGLVLLIVGVAITLIKGDIPTNLMSLMELLYGAFVLGNGFEYAAIAFSSRKKKPKNVV